LDGYYIVKNEDFVYNPRISTSAPVGPINRNKLGRTGVMSPLYTVFRPHDIDTTYLEYFFKCGYWHSFMNFNGDSGARSDRFSIRDNVFFQMPIPIPDIDEQRKIGELLTCLDNLITLHQRQPFLHSTSEISLTVQLIHPFYTSSWEQRKVSDLAEKTYGGGTPTTSNEAYWNGDIPWIQSSDVVDGKLLGVEPRKWITQDGLNNSAAQLIPENSIAIITRVGVGKLAFMPYSYATSQDFLSLSKLNVEPFFAVYACHKKLQSELNAVQGTSIKGITKDELLAKSIMVPRYAEQQQIGAFFKQLDNLITLHQRKGKAAVTGCSNDANNSKGVYCKTRDFGYKCYKEVKSQQIRCLIAVFIFCV
jgi:type I restriction enzyme S subunit